MFRTQLAGSPAEAYGYAAYDALGRVDGSDTGCQTPSGLGPPAT